MEQIPEWMLDPSVKDMDPKKLRFLCDLFSGRKGRTQKEIMSYMMLKVRQAKAENIQFSSTEISTVIAAIQRHSTPEELKSINQIINMTGHRPPGR